MGIKRVNVKAILADPDLRRKLMVPTIQAIQAREGIETTPEQADRAYYVVSEGERATFFDLKQFKGERRNESDQRQEVFVRALCENASAVRFDVSRRDFQAVDSAPLVYEKIGKISHVFKESLPLDPDFADVRRGAYAGQDARYVRMRWELSPQKLTCGDFVWVPFAKGGDYCRFYYNFDLLVHWDQRRRTFAEFHGRKGRETERPESLDYFFRSGLTWPLRTQRGLNVRVMPAGHVFANISPSIFVHDKSDELYLLGVLNSRFAEYLASCFVAFGAWQTGVLKRMPVHLPSPTIRKRIAFLAETILLAKAKWDTSNETSTEFSVPWLIRDDIGGRSLTTLLDVLHELEVSGEAHIGSAYSDLNDEVYRLYGIPDATRKTIEDTLGDRPPEILWPQMEGKTAEQKRMEHVWRLLSYAVKRVLEADDDGIVPFNAVNGEPRLVDRLRHELAGLFPGRDANQIEVEIVNELRCTVKGYRKCVSLDEWLDNVFFEYHCGLYKKRPIFWHIASAQGTTRFAFGALVHYHRFDKNRMAKLRASYLRDAIEEFRREAGLADKAGRTDDRLEWQAKVEETQALDRKLQLIQEGRVEGAEGGDGDFRILTPWKSADERPKGWDPDLDDGVKVNIEPFEKAGVLRIGKVT